MRNREYHISVYLGDKEYRHLNHIKRISKLKTSSILRKLIMGAEIRNAPQTNHQLIGEINAIGVNINQIAKVANTCGYVNNIQVSILQQEVEQLKQVVGDGIGDN